MCRSAYSSRGGTGTLRDAGNGRDRSGALDEHGHERGSDEPRNGRLSRRAFLAGIGAGTAYVISRGPRWTALFIPTAANPSNPIPSRTVTLLRREDMFKATYRFYDIAFSGTGDAMTFAPNGSNPTVVVELPAQSIGEETFTTEPASTKLARATLSGPSRLAFIVSGTETFSAAALMSWTTRVLRLAPSSDATGPTVIETGVEAPWGMMMSPPSGAIPAPRVIESQPLTHRGITGLWFAEFATTLGPFLLRTPPKMDVLDVRQSTAAGERLVPSITESERLEIRNATENSDPVDVKRMLLSPLGAWVDLEGNWSGNVDGAQGLTQWRHRMTMGRDQYVRIIEKGFLFPFGHRAVKIKVVERKISADNRAYLHEREFIAVRQSEVDYDDSPASERNGGRRWPFRKVRLTTLITPDLRAAGERELVRYGSPYPNDNDSDPFWVQDRSGADVRFGVVATDVAGNGIEFTLPLIFAEVSDTTYSTGRSISYDPAAWGKITAAYAKPSSRNTIDLGGQKVALAPEDGAGAGVTSYQTSKLVLSATNQFALPSFVARTLLYDGDVAGFRPELKTADVRIDQLETMTGGKVKSATIQIAAPYINDGYDLNPSGVFASLVEQVGVTFPADRSGGVVTPNISIAGLARDLGPVGDIESLVGDSAGFDPVKYFSQVADGVELPKILGGLSLTDILGLNGGTDKAPQYKTTTLYPGGDTSQLPEGFETRMDWTPPLKGFGPFQLRNNASLAVHGLFVTKVSGDPVQSEVKGELKNFTMAVGPIALDFDLLKFESLNGSKPDVELDIFDVRFIGDLAFLNEFTELMKSTGLGGLAIDPGPTQVSATYTLGIPDVEVGVFALKNLSLVAGLTIPYDGSKPAVLAFDFGSKTDPFLVSISCFAGSGYFGVELTPAGVKTLDISIGFGASVAFNIPPVLYGGVSIQAGVLISVAEGPEDPDTNEPTQIAKVGGFLSLKGEAEVCGVVSVSISLYLSFVYVDGDGVSKIHAEGVLTIEVDVALFSKTITKTVSYDFGDGADPTLAQTWTFDDWQTYCQAFNPVLA